MAIHSPLKCSKAAMPAGSASGPHEPPVQAPLFCCTAARVQLIGVSQSEPVKGLHDASDVRLSRGSPKRVTSLPAHFLSFFLAWKWRWGDGLGQKPSTPIHVRHVCDLVCCFALYGVRQTAVAKRMSDPFWEARKVASHASIVAACLASFAAQKCAAGPFLKGSRPLGQGLTSLPRSL